MNHESPLFPKVQRGDIAKIATISKLPYMTVSDAITGRVRNPGILTVRRIEAALQQLEAERKRKPARQQNAKAGAR
jgi:predicted transcriptional regulator